MSDDAKTDVVGVVLTVGDGEYRIPDVRAVTAVDVREFRRQTGQPFAWVLANLESLDLDLVAGLVWMARRLAGEFVDYDEIAGSITYGSDPKARAVAAEPDPET